MVVKMWRIVDIYGRDDIIHYRARCIINIRKENLLWILTLHDYEYYFADVNCEAHDNFFAA